jgi:hypothetical protein
LLDHGANIDEKGKYENTPLDLANDNTKAFINQYIQDNMLDIKEPDCI